MQSGRDSGARREWGGRDEPECDCGVRSTLQGEPLKARAEVWHDHSCVQKLACPLGEEELEGEQEGKREGLSGGYCTSPGMSSRGQDVRQQQQNGGMVDEFEIHFGAEAVGLAGGLDEGERKEGRCLVLPVSLDPECFVCVPGGVFVWTEPSSRSLPQQLQNASPPQPLRSPKTLLCRQLSLGWWARQRLSPTGRKLFQEQRRSVGTLFLVSLPFAKPHHELYPSE